jgi:hypothetical protein
LLAPSAPPIPIEPSSNLESTHDVQDLVRQARAAHKQGNVDEAVARAEDLLDVLVKDGADRRLLGRVAPLLDAIFAARVGPTSIRVGRGTADPARQNLSAHAQRIANRAEGGATVADLIATATMPRRAATRLIAGLLRRGVLVQVR